ncbi:hypothetical protein [Pseudoflavonifractor capillosus]|uniref:Uncharacterized protein n=1 Tax=Pseudoflavonifractor capillosus TaxID=106588 RepID=A0A921MLV1_9FIRM|nr:hypothetical protein [Pseudoflavonifractor capillosus]HJG86625.1 hypothetical protein [Pseudoflavonifractor capillosus]
MEFSHYCNAYFHWRVSMRQWKVQGFWTKLSKNTALEQSHLALKALGFKACGSVQYAL